MIRAFEKSTGEHPDGLHIWLTEPELNVLVAMKTIHFPVTEMGMEVYAKSPGELICISCQAPNGHITVPNDRKVASRVSFAIVLPHDIADQLKKGLTLNYNRPWHNRMFQVCVGYTTDIDETRQRLEAVINRKGGTINKTGRESTIETYEAD